MTTPAPNMTSRTVDCPLGPAAPVASTSEPCPSLAAKLAGEMAAAWRQGRRLLAEDFLRRHAELYEQPQQALRLIHEEICLRHEYGEQVDWEAIVQRFPHWQEELQLLLDCHRLVEDNQAPVFPEVGETLGDFRLLAELGRGAEGRVFLATQVLLADRPVVVKLTPCDGEEHLTLARLQHTYIVPLYFVHYFPDKGLRGLCMPFLGGATLAALLTKLPERVQDRTGRHLLQALDEAQAGRPVSLPSNGPARRLLAGANYVQAVCWIGACLADALHYAHERSFIHLDLKLSNVLLAADGQPMLLDFHLAREPIYPGKPLPASFGGTASYMSPEQRAAFLAIREGKPVPGPVDGRSDIYSLGLVLYEALGGTVGPHAEAAVAELRRRNAKVTVGLADVLEKCLAREPSARYADAAALAADLRRHLSDLPLTGVPNRSLRERWRKWRRRRPYALAVVGMLMVVLAASLMVAALALGHVRQGLGEGENALAAGQAHLKERHYAEAVRVLGHGRSLVQGLPGAGDLTVALEAQLRRATRAKAAQDLHQLADQLRFAAEADSKTMPAARELQDRCRALWQTRGQITDSREAELDSEIEKTIEADLLDLGLLWANLRVRLAPHDETAQARRDALRVLEELETLVGPSRVLYRDRQAYAQALGWSAAAEAAGRRAAELAPRTAWEHYALGRSLFRSGELPAAAAEFERALLRQPQSFWANFYQGLCAYRLGRYADAVAAFQVCVALAPQTAECFYNRALALAALGRGDHALGDYDRALELNPTLAPAALNRGILHYRSRSYAKASADLEQALRQGADPATVHYNLALVHLAQEDRAGARASLLCALQYNASHQEARRLYERLQRQP